MAVSRLVSAPNWRYALGELLLIVVGVTIALAATTWYEKRQERRVAKELLILRRQQATRPVAVHHGQSIGLGRIVERRPGEVQSA